MIQLLDQAMCQLPAAELAAGVRDLDDEVLAAIVRSNDALRRRMMQAALGVGVDKPTPPKPIPPPGLRPSERKALAKSNGGGRQAPTAASSAKGKKAKGQIARASILAELKAAGEEGAKARVIAETLQMTRDACGFQLRKLKSQGKVRMTGTRKHARWFTA